MSSGAPTTPTEPALPPAPRQDARPRQAARVAVAIRWAVVLSWLVASVVPASAQSSSRAVGGTVTEIVIKGNRSIPVEEIRAKLKTRVGREYNQRFIDEDVQKLLSTSWFADVQPYYAKDPKKPDGLIVTFEVSELPVLRAVEFRNMTKLKLKEVEESTGLKVGNRADFLKCQMAVGQIQRMYADKGYEWAAVRLLEGGKPGDTRAIYEIFEGPKCRLVDVTFTGNSFVSGEVLRTKTASKRAILGLGGTFHRDDMEEDARKLREYYQSQGFFEVKVRPVVRRDANMGDVRVEFVIWEGTQFKVRNIRFEGNKLINSATLRNGLVMHSGKPFSDDLREADRKNLQGKYGAIGCIDAQVGIEREYADPEKSPGVVDLVYRIDEGVPYRLGRLIFKGNSRTLDAVLRREANMAGLVPGEPIDAQRIEKFEQRLKNLKYFSGGGGPGGQGKPIEIKLVNRRPADDPFGGSIDIEAEPARRLPRRRPAPAPERRRGPRTSPAATVARAAGPRPRPGGSRPARPRSRRRGPSRPAARRRRPATPWPRRSTAVPATSSPRRSTPLSARWRPR